MEMSAVGKIADKLWYEITDHTKHVKLGEFVVMPNHIHGIIIIENAPVETRHALSLQSQSPGQSRLRNPGKMTISTIIGGYKSAISKQCNKSSHDFAWQSRFYDRIIRNDAEYDRIVQYIVNNPINWENDKLYSG